MSANAYHTRNRIFLDNYTTFDRLATVYARKVHHIFPSVMVCDLIGYALEGIIIALDKADLSSSSWLSYVRRYAFLNTMNGALIMTGRYRVRTKHAKSRHIQHVTCIDYSKLVCYSDKNQLIQYNSLDTILHCIMAKDQAQWFLNKLNNTLQHKIIQLLINHHTVPQIAAICHLTSKKTRKIILSLPELFQMALENIDISCRLTPIHPT